jgi:phosphoribosylamine--glycine ligase
LEISGLEAVTGGLVFHAGTAMEDDRVVTNGGRVVVVGGRGETLAEAARVAYAAVGEIHFEGMHFRKDIGADLEGY